nr:Trk family potassium uptake protein [bacterium]
MQKIGIRLNQSFSLTPARAMVLSLLVLIEIAAVILYLPVCHTEACHMNFADALFLATSCVCVTGLTTVNVATEISRTGHWAMMFFVQLGALGIILFSSSLFLMLGGRLQLRARKMIQESLPGITLTSVVRLTRYIVLFVFVTE